MNSYIVMDKTNEKKESVIGTIKKHKRKTDKTVDHSHSMNDDMELLRYMKSIIKDAIHF